MSTHPRVLDASRPRLRVEVEVSEAAELLLSLATLLGDNPPESFDLGGARIAELRAAIAPDLLDLGSLFFGNAAGAAHLLGLVYESPAPRRVADFVAYLESSDPLEVELSLLGYYTRGHHIAQPETIRQAALGDAGAREELVTAAAAWEEKGLLLGRVLDMGAEHVRSHLVELVRRWNSEVFEASLDEVRPELERDAAEKRSLAATLSPTDFVVRATSGIAYTAPPEIHALVFFPSWWFRPWVLMSEHKHVRIFGYPVGNDGTGDGANLGDLARLYKALGDEKRLALLRLLRKGPLALGAAAKEVGLSKSTTHHHLAILRQAGLVLIRDDEENSYSLRAERLRELDSLLERSL